MGFPFHGGLEECVHFIYPLCKCVNLIQFMCSRGDAVVKTLQVYRTAWWAAHYKAPTPKRHYCYANSSRIYKLDKGKLTGWKRSANYDQVKTAVQYTDSRGKRRWTGTRALKRTECLDMFEYSNCVPFFHIIWFNCPFQGENCKPRFIGFEFLGTKTRATIKGVHASVCTWAGGSLPWTCPFSPGTASPPWTCSSGHPVLQLAPRDRWPGLCWAGERFQLFTKESEPPNSWWVEGTHPSTNFWCGAIKQYIPILGLGVAGVKQITFEHHNVWFSISFWSHIQAAQQRNP